MGTSEALPVPGLVLVCYTTASNDLVALDAPRGEFFFVTFGAIDFLLPWDEALGTNWNLANTAAETFLMPLSGFVFHFLGSSSEYFIAAITSRGELVVITTAAVDPFSL